jgi:hypothetical protein
VNSVWNLVALSIYLFGFTNKLFGFSDMLFGSTNKLFGSTNKLFGFTNKLFGSSNKLFGFTNKLFGSSNKLFGLSCFFVKNCVFLSKKIRMNMEKITAFFDSDKTKGMPHNGKLLHLFITHSRLSISEVARRMGVVPSTLHCYFKSDSLSLEVCGVRQRPCTIISRWLLATCCLSITRQPAKRNCKQPANS